MKRRVVVTGLGANCPLGRGVKNLWPELLENKTSIGYIGKSPRLTRLYKDFSKYDVKVGSLFLDDYNLSDNHRPPNLPENISQRELERKASNFMLYSLEATCEALEDSGLDIRDDQIPTRAGVVLGVGFGGIAFIEEQEKKLHGQGMDKVSPLFVPKILSNSAPGLIARAFYLHGECKTVNSACASGVTAISDAYKSIVLEEADVMICGGTEEVSPIAFAGFGNMKALSKNPRPKEACRPYDRNRDGFIIGEGAGILVLEEFEHARNRGAKIYCELKGYGATCDAHHQTQPEPGGKYMALAIQQALEKARINPDQINYINAHGTSTQLNDKTETIAIKRALSGYAKRPIVNSTKSQIGHTLGAAGALETIASIKSLETGLIPPTRNLEKPDPECDLNHANQVIERNIDYFLKLSSGFSGHNGVLIFGRHE